MHVKIRIGSSSDPDERWEFLEFPQVKDPRELLDALVEKGLEKYENKANGASLFRYITEKDLKQQAETGKITFQAIYHEGKINLTKAKRAARESFEDGLMCLFINGQQFHGLDEALILEDEAEIIIVKLTMLTGNYFD